MKKLILSMAVILLTVFSVNAQSFSLEWDGEAIGDTITVNADSATATEVVFEAIFKNNSENGANVKVIRNEISMVENSGSYFCWVACYPPNVDTSGVSKFIAAGSETIEGDFSAHYTPNNTIGVSLIEYVFYNEDNPEENVTVVVKFDTSPSGIDENILKNSWLSEVYPNPATNYVNIDYKLPNEVTNASVKIVNILGSVVKEQIINTQNSSIRMDVSDMNGGIYFYSVFINEDVFSTKKLIIR
ncbi:MAG: T9SS type A sorting domain-containing protein [Bacteroidota bacterium]